VTDDTIITEFPVYSSITLQKEALNVEHGIKNRYNHSQNHSNDGVVYIYITLLPPDPAQGLVVTAPGG
jgi:hypothetical protein